jgi:AcrR family transcriptional regulator
VTAPTPKAHSPHRASRETILSVSGEIFAERGYEAATIKEITDRAGVNVASVNYYFRDKLGLYTEVLRMGVHDGRLSIPPESAGLSPEERLTRYIESFMRSILAVGRPSWCGRLMIREIAQPTPALPQIVEDIIRPNFFLMRQLVADVAGAPLEHETLRLLTYSVIAQCCYWKTAQPILPHLWPELKFDDETVRRIAGQIAAFSTAGIRAAVAKEGSPQ